MITITNKTKSYWKIFLKKKNFFYTELHKIQISKSLLKHDEEASHKNLYVYNPYKVYHKWNVNKIHIEQNTLILYQMEYAYQVTNLIEKKILFSFT
jgi:hypothetical protein